MNRTRACIVSWYGKMGDLYCADPDPVVAAFNMVGALTMLVWEKQKDIHVLKAAGGGRWKDPTIFLTRVSCWRC